MRAGTGVEYQTLHWPLGIKNKNKKVSMALGGHMLVTDLKLQNSVPSFIRHLNKGLLEQREGKS